MLGCGTPPWYPSTPSTVRTRRHQPFCVCDRLHFIAGGAESEHRLRSAEHSAVDRSCGPLPEAAVMSGDECWIGTCAFQSGTFCKEAKSGSDRRERGCPCSARALTPTRPRLLCLPFVPAILLCCRHHSVSLPVSQKRRRQECVFFTK